MKDGMALGRWGNKKIREQAAPRNIQPIDVAERWALCPHLRNVVICLAQAGHKITRLEQARLGQTRFRQTHLEQTRLQQTRLEQSLLKPLKRAESYLEREINASQPCPYIPIGAQPFTTETVLEGWGLPFHLGEALFFVKASKSPSMREESLTQALMHLRAEIALWERQARQTHSNNNPTGGKNL